MPVDGVWTEVASIPLSATSGYVDIVLESESLDFGVTSVNREKRLQLCFRNEGTASGKYAIRIENNASLPEFSICPEQLMTGRLYGGDRVQLDVVFFPQKEEKFVGAIIFQAHHDTRVISFKGIGK